MANEEPGSAAADELRRRRVPPPTIDLEATDVSAPAHPTTSETPPSGGPKPRSARRWPLVLAGALGALLVLIAAGGAWVFMWGIPSASGGPSGDTADTAARLARIEAQLGALAHNRAAAGIGTGDTKLPDDVTARLAHIESTLVQQSAAVDRQIKPLADQLADLDHRDQAVMAVAQIARERADAAAKSLADVAQQLAQLNAERARTPQVERSDVDTLAARLASLESATKAISAQLARMSGAGDVGNARQAQLAVALDAAVQRGAPYARELAAIDPSVAGSATLAALQPFAATGVPSVPALAHEASALVPALVSAADTARPQGMLARLWASAERMIRLRPVGDVAGTSSDAVIARLEVKAGQDDVDGVLAEAGNLPAAARAPLEPWIKRAQARRAALAAADRLATDALNRLGQGAGRDTKQDTTQGAATQGTTTQGTQQP